MSNDRTKTFAFVSVNKPSDKLIELLWKDNIRLAHIKVTKRNRILSEKDREFFSNYAGIITGNVSFALQLLPSHIIGWVEYIKNKETSENEPIKFHQYDFIDKLNNSEKYLRQFEVDYYK